MPWVLTPPFCAHLQCSEAACLAQGAVEHLGLTYHLRFVQGEQGGGCSHPPRPCMWEARLGSPARGPGPGPGAGAGAGATAMPEHAHARQLLHPSTTPSGYPCHCVMLPADHARRITTVVTDLCLYWAVFEHDGPHTLIRYFSCTEAERGRAMAHIRARLTQLSTGACWHSSMASTRGRAVLRLCCSPPPCHPLAWLFCRWQRT